MRTSLTTDSDTWLLYKCNMSLLQLCSCSTQVLTNCADNRLTALHLVLFPSNANLVVVVVDLNYLNGMINGRRSDNTSSGEFRSCVTIEQYATATVNTSFCRPTRRYLSHHMKLISNSDCSQIIIAKRCPAYRRWGAGECGRAQFHSIHALQKPKN